MKNIFKKLFKKRTIKVEAVDVAVVSKEPPAIVGITEDGQPIYAPPKTEEVVDK